MRIASQWQGDGTQYRLKGQIKKSQTRDECRRAGYVGKSDGTAAKRKEVSK